MHAVYVIQLRPALMATVLATMAASAVAVPMESAVGAAQRCRQDALPRMDAHAWGSALELLSL